MPRALAFLVGAAVALATGCPIADGEYFGAVPAPDPTHFRWCNSGEPEYLDPAMATATNDMKVVLALFDGLTDHDPQGLPEPSLATRWEISADQRTFTFHLRDDARWSNGRPITSADFIYSYARVLHPLTASPRSETLWKLRHGKPYTMGVAKLVLRDAEPFRAGDVVEVLPSGKDAKGKDVFPPDSNARRAAAALPLRAEPAEGAATWATVPARAEVTVVELGGAGRAWAWVYFAEGDGVYGWAPLAALEEPNADREYAVRALDGSQRAGTLRGRDLLMLPELVGMRAPDPHTLVLETEGPTPYLLDLTLQQAMRPTPREAVGPHPRRWIRPEHIVTSGPFHLASWRQRDKIELTRSTTFWGRDAVRLERVTIYSLDDQAASAATYYTGGCDAIAQNHLPATWYPVLAGETGSRIRRKDYHRAAALGIYFYLINGERLSNRHLRRALSHALDREMLPMLLRGGQIPTEQYTPGKRIAELGDDELALCGVTRDTPGVALIVEKGAVCYVPPMGARFDLEAARRELELARRELGAAFPATITIKFNTGSEAHKHIAEWIQHEWKRHLGLDVRLESQEWKTFLKATREGEYDVARFGGQGNFPDPEGEFLPAFRCDHPDNRTRFCDPEVERLFEEAGREPERRRRMEIIRRAEEIIIDEAVVLPLYVYTQHHLQRPYVRGLAINLTDQQSLRDVWIDRDWRRSAP